MRLLVVRCPHGPEELAVGSGTVRELALGLQVPLKTAQDWVYRGVVPSAPNQTILTDYIISHCAHDSTDTPEFWNDIWAGIDDCGSGSGSDQILIDQVMRLTPGRALDYGCGTGGNAIWLAKQGWTATAVDHSKIAIEKGKRLAAEQGVNVEIVVADATLYQPQGDYELITCFYIQMFPAERANMPAKMSKALSPGGTLLFVNHDKSGPPSGWSVEDLQSLTTPEEVVAELSGLQIQEAVVLDHGVASSEVSHMRGEAPHQADDSHGGSNILRAIRPTT